MAEKIDASKQNGSRRSSSNCKSSRSLWCGRLMERESADAESLFALPLPRPQQ